MGVDMETRRRKSTDVAEFAKRLILSREYESTLRRRVQEGQISRDFAKTLLGYARSPQGSSPRAVWLEERTTLAALQRIADGDTEH
jgi:hypothetical protein